MMSKHFFSFALDLNMKDVATFQLALLEEAKSFLEGIPRQAQNKILYNIWRVAGGEMRVAYRLFAFWDTDTQTLVVATHGFIKKAQKTPKKEIARAETIMKNYFGSKNG